MRLLLVLTAAAICFAATEQPEKLQNDEDTRQTIVEGANKFALVSAVSLFRETKEEQNFIFSPINIYFTLSMLHLGSAGATRSQIAEVLGLPTDESQVSKVHQTMKQILQSIQYGKRGYSLAEVNIANGIFLRKELKIKSSYANESEEYYNSRAINVDFAKDGRAAVDLINNWCSNRTEGRISKIFEETLDSSTAAVLASALYFSGKWNEPFRARDTKTEQFNTGKRMVDVPMMNRKGRVRYLNNTQQKYEAISLNYAGNNFSMSFILPYGDQTLTNLTQILQAEHVQSVFSAQRRQVDYKIPRMKFSFSTSLKETFKNLRLSSIFADADLSNMIDNPQSSIKIDEALHAAEIEVDEEGTKASSITAIQIVARSGHHSFDDPIPFYVNKPFIIAIEHRPTKMLIFMGSVHKPI